MTDTPPGQAADTPPGQAPDTPSDPTPETPSDQTPETPPDHTHSTPSALDLAIEGAFTFAQERIQATITELELEQAGKEEGLYPTTTETQGPRLGHWKYGAYTDWRSGFFPGALWQLYRKTANPAFAALARRWTQGVEIIKDEPIDHDLGFRLLPTSGQELCWLREQDDPGGARREHAKSVLLTAAHSLDTRFNKGGVPVGAFRSLDDYLAPYPVHIDTMMNVPLLFVGWDLCGRPVHGPCRVLYEHGVKHASTVLQENVRADFGTYHVIQFNDGTEGTPKDGHVHAKITDQGFANESTWSRGQAWALYGFAEVYRYTKEDGAVSPDRFLLAAMQTADYFIDHLPNNFEADPKNHRLGDFVPPNDFDAALGEPAGPWNDANGDSTRGDRRPGTGSFTPRDASAAAAAASGLLALSTLVEPPVDGARYVAAAESILWSLLTFRDEGGELAYLAESSVHQGILANASVAYGRPSSSLIYGDYYLLEAMNRYLTLKPGESTQAPPGCF